MTRSVRSTETDIRQFSPNQIVKREQIVQAASRIMVREGLAACTARSVSAGSGLSTSAIHYYFNDIDEILDEAFRAVMERFFVQLEQAAAAHDNPVRSLWAAASAYFERSSDSIMASDGRGVRHAPMLWFEFQAQSLRSGRTQTVTELSQRGSVFFQTLIEACDISPSTVKAETLYCSLLGAAIRNSLVRRPTPEWVASLFSALDLPLP
jgi:DNA-binding transcriptional regulator YbjK